LRKFWIFWHRMPMNREAHGEDETSLREANSAHTRAGIDDHSRLGVPRLRETAAEGVAGCCPRRRARQQLGLPHCGGNSGYRTDYAILFHEMAGAAGRGYARPS